MIINDTITKSRLVIINRIEKLEGKLAVLKERCDERWPYEIYGLRGLNEYENRSNRIREELFILRAYNKFYGDLIRATTEYLITKGIKDGKKEEYR